MNMVILPFKQGDRVVILRSDKGGTYRTLIGTEGTVIKVSGKSLGVAVDGHRNSSSSYGCYWFKYHELGQLEEKECTGMNREYPKVAVVELLNDLSKKPYSFQLYDENAKEGDLVVVNPRFKDNRVLGHITCVRDSYPCDDCTAEVLSVVDMTAYKSRVESRQKKQELLNKKSELEQKIKKSLDEINLREFYRAMAEKHKDTNPELADLVSQLDSIDEELK